MNDANNLMEQVIKLTELSERLLIRITELESRVAILEGYLALITEKTP